MSLSEQQQQRLRYLICEPFIFDVEEAKWDECFEQAFSQIESSEELHHYAANYNWDGGIGGLQDILHHPLCDKGTALMIYALGQPGYFYQRRKLGKPLTQDEQEQFAFLQNIEHQVMENTFLHHNISCNPRNFEGIDWFEEEASDLGNHLVPAYMKQPSEGIEVHILRF